MVATGSGHWHATSRPPTRLILPDRRARHRQASGPQCFTSLLLTTCMLWYAMLWPTPKSMYDQLPEPHNTDSDPIGWLALQQQDRER
jgi:hypothetical protein